MLFCFILLYLKKAWCVASERILPKEAGDVFWERFPQHAILRYGTKQIKYKDEKLNVSFQYKKSINMNILKGFTVILYC